MRRSVSHSDKRCLTSRESAENTQMIQVAIGGVQTVTYLTQGYAVGELTEYHAHKVTPCVKTLAMFVRSMLFNLRFN